MPLLPLTPTTIRGQNGNDLLERHAFRMVVDMVLCPRKHPRTLRCQMTYPVYCDTRLIGHVSQNPFNAEWEAESSVDDKFWGCIDTKEEAEELLSDHYRQSEGLFKQRLWCSTCGRDFSKYELAATRYCFKCHKFIPFLKKKL